MVKFASLCLILKEEKLSLVDFSPFVPSFLALTSLLSHLSVYPSLLHVFFPSLDQTPLFEG
jgi:hypothetical protein